MSGTSSSKFTAAATVPNQESWGHYQRFTFEDTFPHVKLQAFSTFAPTVINTSTIDIETRNSKYAGFRFQQLSQTTDTNQFGSFYFKSFLADGAGTNIYSFDGTNFNFYYPVDFNFQNIINVGNIGVGISSPNIQLQFSNALNDCKICLYQIAANEFQVYGIGVIAGTLKYSIGNNTSSHVFYAAASSTSSTELFRIHGSGYATVLLGDGTFYSRVPSATWFKAGSSSTTTTAANTWIKAVSTSSLAPPNRQFTSSTNRITFTGSDLSTDSKGMFSATAVLSPSSGTPKLGLAVYLNGTNILGCQAYVSPTVAGGIYTLSITNTMCELNPADYLEIWVLTSTATTLTVSELSLSFIAC